MTEDMMKKAEILTKDYNDFLEKEYFSYITQKGVYTDEQKVFDEARGQIFRDWENRPVEGLDGTTPKDFIGGIDSLEDLITLFDYISSNSFDSVPECLIDGIERFGDKGAELIADKLDFDIAQNYDMNSVEMSEEDHKKAEAAMSALSALSRPGFGGEKVIKRVIGFIENCRPESEMFLERAAAALSLRISESYPIAIEYIKNTEQLGEREEFILSALCDIKDEYKNDEIYKCLKDSFRRMKNPVLGAVFLGDYGDCRAIPALRRFAMENLGKCSMDDYYTVVAVIEKLGGIIEDLLPEQILH